MCVSPGIPHWEVFHWVHLIGDLVVTKKEIVKTISEEIGLTQLKTKEIVQKTFDAIVDTLVEDKRIELRNFGVFEVKKRAARKARNPRTGEKVLVPEKYVVTFKPGKEMEGRVRELVRQAAEKAAREALMQAPHSARNSSQVTQDGSMTSEGSALRDGAMPAPLESAPVDRTLSMPTSYGSRVNTPPQ
jgi:integration host factor subunit beta